MERGKGWLAEGAEEGEAVEGKGEREDGLNFRGKKAQVWLAPWFSPPFLGSNYGPSRRLGVES